MRHLLFVILLLIIANISFGVELNVMYEWKYINFTWDSEQQEMAIKSGDYDPNVIALYDVDVAPDGRMFVTSVREKGVPASLMTVSKEEGPNGPLLAPYPDWSWYQNDNDSQCNGIISVYRVDIKCNHLFVLDCGKIGVDAVCPPQLLIFNLEDDSLVDRVIIPPDIANNKNGSGLLVTPLADVRHCNIDNATVFMADIEGYGLVIYKKHVGFCRIESDCMKPTDPNFTIDNESFYLEDGILGLTIIHGKLYYAALAGKKICSMKMFDLQKCSILSDDVADELTQVAGILDGQTAPIASEHCAIFFNNIPETSILCADAIKKFDSNNTEIIVQNAEDLQFVSGMKVRKEKLLGLSNRFQHVYSGTLNPNETNFRIFSIDISQIRKEKENCFASCKHHNHRSWIRPDKPKPWFEPDKSWSHWIPWYLKHWFNEKWNTSSTLIFSKNP